MTHNQSSVTIRPLGLALSLVLKAEPGAIAVIFQGNDLALVVPAVGFSILLNQFTESKLAASKSKSNTFVILLLTATVMSLFVLLVAALFVSKDLASLILLTGNTIGFLLFVRLIAFCCEISDVLGTKQSSKIAGDSEQ